MEDEDFIYEEFEKLVAQEPNNPDVSTNKVDQARLLLAITGEVATRDAANKYAEESMAKISHYDDELKKVMKDNNMPNNSFQFTSNVSNLNVFSQIPGLNKDDAITKEDLNHFCNTFRGKQSPKYLEQAKPKMSRKFASILSACNSNLIEERNEPESRRTVFKTAKQLNIEKVGIFDDLYNPSQPTKQAKQNRSQNLAKHSSTSSGNDIEERKEQETKFKTAYEELEIQNAKKLGINPRENTNKRTLGGKKKFVSPLLAKSSKIEEEEEEVDERLKHIDPKMVELIRSEIMDMSTATNWDDISGLEFAKEAIKESVVWPILRPDIFKGLRRPPKGILLFGPPGTGKTLIGKCVASQSKSTFFSISASSLTSKWIGDGEKMVRALFAVARCHQPSVIFIDEIDSLLCQRSDTEHESSRRLKTEFLVQLDGATTESEERLLVIGATNRPQELDEAARRRLVKRLYIPLPETEARLQLVKKLMSTENHSLSRDDLEAIAKLSEGYSGADMKNLCSDAALGPIRCISFSQFESIQAQEVRPITINDFKNSLKHIRASVSPSDLEHFVIWDRAYGSGNV